MTSRKESDCFFFLFLLFFLPNNKVRQGLSCRHAEGRAVSQAGVDGRPQCRRPHGGVDRGGQAQLGAGLLVRDSRQGVQPHLVPRQAPRRRQDHHQVRAQSTSPLFRHFHQPTTTRTKNRTETKGKTKEGQKKTLDRRE